MSALHGHHAVCGCKLHILIQGIDVLARIQMNKYLHNCTIGQIHIIARGKR